MVGASLPLCEELAGCLPACGGFPSLGGGQGGTRALTPNQLPSPAYLENDPSIGVDGGKMETVCYKIWKAYGEMLWCFGSRKKETTLL